MLHIIKLRIMKFKLFNKYINIYIYIVINWSLIQRLQEVIPFQK